MIPQRNISLLSNRLAAGGGTRIREDVLERDYCLAWFLCGLSESDLRPALAFKGGTALKRCYFSDYRFSEDLDFTLRQPLAFEEIRARLERFYVSALWTTRLAHQMTSLPPFEQVFRALRRTWRQAKLP